MPKGQYISGLICTGYFKKINDYKMKKILLLIGGVAFFLASCESKTYSEISKPVTNPTYEANVKPVVDANCTSCHKSGDQDPPLTNYAEVKDEALNGNFLCRINANCGVMPPDGKMNQATVNMINLWVNQGCVEK